MDFEIGKMNLKIEKNGFLKLKEWILRLKKMDFEIEKNEF